MTPNEFAALKADIAEHGLKDQITLIDTAILDGRHRYRACMELGIRPSVRQWVEAIDGRLLETAAAYEEGLKLRERYPDAACVADACARAGIDPRSFGLTGTDECR